MIGDDDNEGTFFAANASTPDAVISFLMDANLRATTSILSWLTMLPALRQLELRLNRSIRLNCDQLELENFLAEAPAALPRVAVADWSLG